MANVAVRVYLDQELLTPFSWRTVGKSELGNWMARSQNFSVDLVHVAALRPEEGIRWFKALPGIVDPSGISVEVRFTDELDTRWKIGPDKRPVEADDSW